MVFRCMPLLSLYNSLEMGPRRDVLGELREEAENVACTSVRPLTGQNTSFLSHGKGIH